MIIDTTSPKFLLQLGEVDEMHMEFAELVDLLAMATGNEFVEIFAKLYDHSHAHFAREKELMESIQYASLAEHDSEHQRILGEIKQYQRKVNKGAISFARAYVTDRLPEWFNLHLTTMDSAMVIHLNQQSA